MKLLTYAEWGPATGWSRKLTDVGLDWSFAVPDTLLQIPISWQAESLPTFWENGALGRNLFWKSLANEKTGNFTEDELLEMSSIGIQPSSTWSIAPAVEQFFYTKQLVELLALEQAPQYLGISQAHCDFLGQFKEVERDQMSARVSDPLRKIARFTPLDRAASELMSFVKGMGGVASFDAVATSLDKSLHPSLLLLLRLLQYRFDQFDIDERGPTLSVKGPSSALRFVDGALASVEVASFDENPFEAYCDKQGCSDRLLADILLGLQPSDPAFNCAVYGEDDVELPSGTQKENIGQMPHSTGDTNDLPLPTHQQPNLSP